MTDEMRALAERAVAAGWRWMPGCNPIHIGGYGYKHDRLRNWADAKAIQGNRWYIPDLADPATLGCLLAMVRDAWGPTSHAVFFVCSRHEADSWEQHGESLDGGHRFGHWQVDRPLADGETNFAPPAWTAVFPTEAAALVAALEAAP